MPFNINDTSNYHINDLDSLGWEMTISSMLEPADSPCRKILEKDGTFGILLYDYLSSIIKFDNIKKIIEIGGGYGFLMRDFLSRKASLVPVMLDISPYLLNKQKEILPGSFVQFIGKNFFDADIDFISGFGMAVLNEIIGDFPTLCEISQKDILTAEDDYLITETARLINKYNLDIPDMEFFNFNIGAVQAAEKLCLAGVNYIYMSEHSCEAVAPVDLHVKIDIHSSGYPRKIALKGHDEYTIKFSHIEKVAAYFNYRIIRGSYSDFLKINDIGRLNFILTSGSDKDEHEIIRHFVSDLFLYEYVILISE